ncbi:glutamate--tRNA ligase [Tepidiforma sp.]|uniref:glutamate--tRNA ligase n=1 Tax=Tepidiforma sp. TaxID=2682230 RepID=UPI002ADD856F|nr:glutamate--tRNA ligase [Tepidiforma sp.]
MTDRPVRTRYAPSPTGNPHVGNIRSALFSWAFARSRGGQFILRIEDTDRLRFVEHSVEAIMESLRWLGIDWDEGPDVGGPFGPYFQSQRLEHYRAAAETLIERGRAYRCFCTPERLEQLRAAQAAAKRPPGYDGLCRGLNPAESARRAASEPHVVRFAMPREGTTVLQDVIRGEVVFENALQDDFVMLKSDGFPTYHLAVVVDDTAMRITHCIRGDEWISSAPKHIQLYEALGWERPAWAHLPLILGPDHKKLSKRSGDTALLDYRDRGYLPEAMVNFLALLGWALDDHTTILGVEELTRHFDLARVVPNPAVFDIERLNYLNGHYIRAMEDTRWEELVAEWADRGLPASIPRPLDRAVLRAAAPLLRERVTVLSEVADLIAFLFTDGTPPYDPALLAEKAGDAATAARVLEAAITALDGIAPADWQKEAVEAALRGLEGVLGLKLRKFIPALYVAVMGRPTGIPLFDSLVILGRERTLGRLRAAQALVG